MHTLSHEVSTALSKAVKQYRQQADELGRESDTGRQALSKAIHCDKYAAELAAGSEACKMVEDGVRMILHTKGESSWLFLCGDSKHTACVPPGYSLSGLLQPFRRTVSTQRAKMRALVDREGWPPPLETTGRSWLALSGDHPCWVCGGM